MQIHSVETSAGTAICCAPSRIAWMTGLPMSRLRLMFSTSTVASSTRMPTASASPPSVMMLMVSPSRLRTMTDVRVGSGMDTAMMSVVRQLPRKSRIIAAVRQAAITASRITPLTAARTKIDWSASGWMLSSGGRVGITRGRSARTPAATSRVDAVPVVRIGTSVPRRPSRRTTFVWGANPSRTLATSRRYIVELPTTLIGRSFSSVTVRGLAFIATSYSNSPIFAVPDGSTRFCWPRAVTTSVGDSPFDWSRRWSRSTMTWRCLPPYGNGTDAPGTGHELGPQEVEADVIERRLGEAGQGELEDGHRRRAVVDDQRRLDAGREKAQYGLGDCRHLRVGGIEARVRLQEDLDHRLAVHRRRLDVLDVVHGGGEHPLVLCRN